MYSFLFVSFLKSFFILFLFSVRYIVSVILYIYFNHKLYGAFKINKIKGSSLIIPLSFLHILKNFRILLPGLMVRLQVTDTA